MVMVFDLIKKNKTLQELLIGIVSIFIVCEVLILIFTRNRLYNSIGFVTGTAVSIFCAIHMAWGIEIALTLDEKSSIVFTRKYTVIRYLIMCVTLAAIGITDIASPVTLIFGFLMLKMGAYVNPLIHTIITKIFGGDNNQ